jgi:hypothetical protein
MSFLFTNLAAGASSAEIALWRSAPSARRSVRCRRDGRSRAALTRLRSLALERALIAVDVIADHAQRTND